MLYVAVADALLVIHALFVVFVIGGQALIWAGGLCSWSWVRNPWFRLTHLAAIGLVVLQAWSGIACFLTTWEMALRERGGDAVHAGSFIAYWLGEFLYYHAPQWVFITCYTLFGALVVGSWYWVRPRPFSSSRSS